MTAETTENNVKIARNLSNARPGATFTGLIIRKQGVERGPKGSKVRYGDDLVHAVIVTGFSYMSLVRRSLDKMNAMDLNALLADATKAGLKGFSGRGKNAVEVAVTAQDINDAVDALRDSFQKTLDGTNESTTDHVFETLEVDGNPVSGGRVYVGGGDPNNSKTPKPGDIYLQGLQIGRSVLEAAANGPKPASKSGVAVVAKNFIRGRLPVSRYVSYRLRSGDDFILRVGGTAALAATTDGVAVKDATIKEVFGNSAVA